MDKVLYTIGYGNRKPDGLLKILKDNGINHIHDVRRRGSKAWIRTYWTIQSNGENRMDNWLYRNGIFYDNTAIFGNNENSLEEYAMYLESDNPKTSVLNLGEFIQEKWPRRHCLLCAELDPAKCHRSILAGKLVEMLGNGWKIVHL